MMRGEQMIVAAMCAICTVLLVVRSNENREPDFTYKPQECLGWLNIKKCGCDLPDDDVQRAVKICKDIKSLEASIRIFSEERGFNPDTLEKLFVPANPTRFSDRQISEWTWREDDLPTDPWGRAYKYRPFDGVYTLGSDDAPRGTGAAEDVFGSGKAAALMRDYASAYHKRTASLSTQSDSAENEG